MVGLQYEGVDHLPYLDELITSEEREEVERLIQMELMRSRASPPHPNTTSFVPPLSTLLLGSQLDTFDDDDDFEDDEFTLGGVDMAVYEVPSYTQLSHTLKHQQRTKVLAENAAGLEECGSQYFDLLAAMEGSLDEEIGRKRKQKEEVAMARKKQATEYQRVSRYLEDKWREGVHSMVEVIIRQQD